jgi:alanine-glyoxylate transaminase/(R)-3-amino-2-methylpropionate-pyruvate transaminase
MIGIELVTDRHTKGPALPEAKLVMELLKDEGVIVGRGGLHGNVLRLQPPMVITKADCERFIGALRRALTVVQPQVSART